MITFETLSNENLDIAKQMQHDIFPLEEGSEDLNESVQGIVPSHQFMQKYWLAKKGEKYIGIFGFYAYKDYPKDIWLGWYGVVSDERRKGYGKEILLYAMDLARDMGFENFRLFTDEEDNISAIKLYESIGMECEVYDNPDDIHFEIGKTLIYSKSLTNKKVPKWNNRFLYLNAHEEKNN